MQLSDENEQDIDYESDNEDSALPCDIDPSCNSLKEHTHSIKFKNDQIESAKYAKKSTTEIIDEQKNLISENKSLLKDTLQYFDALFDGTLGT